MQINKKWIFLTILLLTTILLVLFFGFLRSDLIGSEKTKEIINKTELEDNQNVYSKKSPNTTLRSLAEAKGIEVGAAVLMKPFYEDPTYQDILAREFNSLTPENAMKFRRMHPKPDLYNFTNANALVTFAQEHQMQVHGHTLVWHKNLPGWLTEGRWTTEELTDILRRHIYTVVGQFRGEIATWDVVNEAVESDGSLRKTIWLEGIGPEYIEMAFRWAREAEPQAQLFYNDYGGEGLGRKSNAIYELVKNLRQSNVPLDGVGFQMHTSINKPPNPEKVAANIKRLGELGLEVRITEMDVKIHDGEGTTTEKLAAQAEVYRDVLRVCLDAPNCKALTTWGVSDNYSWIPDYFDRPDLPLLFDKSYRPKPGYDALVEELQVTSNE
ncbi:MAG: endo-1,4-beta-xylanase [Symploca sp. SIO2E6]|nr:endo-1,4-beta-xylanase [Symploca sp. SIO2E6]